MVMVPDARFIAAFVAMVLLVSISSSLALSLVSLVHSRSRTTRSSSSALGYMTSAPYYDILDVDGDRMSLRSLLDPPAPPREVLPAPTPEVAASSRAIGSRASQRTSPITALGSVEDYQRHVLHAPNQLSVIRFSAPYCKACRTTR